MSQASIPAPCSGATSRLHNLTCGHTVCTSDASGSSPCLANCSRVDKVGRRAHLYIQPTPIQRIQGHVPSYICLACLRGTWTISLMPTYSRLEKGLLASNPATALWTSMDRLRATVQVEEFRAAMSDERGRLKWIACRRRAKGDAWDMPVNPQEMYMETTMEELEQVFEGGLNIAGDDGIETVVRKLGWMGFGGE